MGFNPQQPEDQQTVEEIQRTVQAMAADTERILREAAEREAQQR